MKQNAKGIDFETRINDSNNYYIEKGIALIHKKPTPVQIVKVQYPKRSKAKIIEAYFKLPSTTDYNGVYKGYYIDFEAKSTNESSFSFHQIFPHQINHLKKVLDHNGISFLIVQFVKYNSVFILETEIFLKKYNLSFEGGRKSISYDEFKNEGYLVKQLDNNLIDYIVVIDDLIKKRTG